MLNGKKIPVNPPLDHDNNFIHSFKEQVEHFNEYFSKECSLIQNRSTLPSVFVPLIQTSFSSFQFTANDIKSIKNKLDPNDLW